MARKLGDFFSPKALSCLRFFQKVGKPPYKGKIGGVDIQEVKAGGDKKFSLFILPVGVWIACNFTNASALGEAWGDDVDVWEGKKVVLSKMVTGFQGKEGFAIKPA